MTRMCALHTFNYRGVAKVTQKTSPFNPTQNGAVREPENRKTEPEHPAGGTNLLDYTAQLADL